MPPGRRPIRKNSERLSESSFYKTMIDASRERQSEATEESVTPSTLKTSMSFSELRSM